MNEERVITRTTPTYIEHEIRGHQVWRHLPEASFVCRHCLAASIRRAARDAAKRAAAATEGAPAMEPHKGTELEKLREQLKAAHETIDVLREDIRVDGITYMRLSQGVLDTLRFHDDCLCRHAKRFLTQAIEPDLRDAARG